MSRLNWSELHDGEDLTRARVKAKTADGFEATLFILNARAESWDVQTVDHSVLAYGSGSSIEDCQERAHSALWAHIRNIAERVAL